jgi:Rod binding domain-containing protein
LSSHQQQGDQAAVFRDTKLSQQRPDFGSFVKQGDERLKMLARPETIPDLRRDFTQSPYQVMIRRMQQQLKAGGLQGLTWEQIEKLMSELGQTEQRMGGDGFADDLMRQMEREGAGSKDKMLSALSKALNRLRDREEVARGKGKALRDATPRQPGAADDNGEGGRDDGSPGGSLPGTEKSLRTRGDPTQRIEGDKQDSTLEGDPRDGRMEAYDTNLSGPGAPNPSRLPYLNLFSQYRKQMEEALTKEPIPFSYREQVKEYFKALEPR